MKSWSKRIISMFPLSWQQEIKRLRYAYQIKWDIFESKINECDFLENIVSKGDIVIDVGANVGYYTAKLSRLVGSEGRVFAFEPVPETFQILTSNAGFFPYKNVTLINAAASNCSRFANMQIPKHETGLQNYYMAHLTDSAQGFRVFCLPIDSMGIQQERIKLVKIDAEGHDYEVLLGMIDLIKRDLPVIILEDASKNTTDFLEGFGYSVSKLSESGNLLFSVQE